jgi:hypothetical protein
MKIVYSETAKIELDDACFHHHHSPSTSQTDILAGQVMIAVWFLHFMQEKRANLQH